MSLSANIMALADEYYENCTQSDEGYSTRDPDAAREALALRAAVADELLATLRAISELHPDKDSDDGYDEWGEAYCFKVAQEMARAAIALATAKAKP